MKTTLIVTLIFSTVLMQACETSTATLENKDIYLTSGQSFGMCVGPCVQSFSLSKTSKDILFEVVNRNVESIPNTDLKNGTSKYYDLLSETDYNAIMAAIDEQKIKALEGTFGCPDCADRGAEWIELFTDGQSYRVNFEYGKSVEGLETLIDLLRTKRQALSTKYVQ